jgi:integrase
LCASRSRTRLRRGPACHVPFNAAAPTRIATDKRGKKRLKAGVDFPLTSEVGRIVAAASDVKARALLMVAAFCGPRGSELRGLPWTNVTIRTDDGMFTVEQRADRFGTIGSPKSEAGHRTIPFGQLVANTLRQLKAQSAGRKLVFGTENDKPDNHSNVVQRIFQRAQIEAGVVNEAGKAKYLGLHTLRHVAASFMLHRREDSGLGLTLKQTQERLGHATLSMTADLYGHLLPVEDDGAGLAAAERHLFAVG